MENPKVFFDMMIGDLPAGRIVMELFKDTAPKTADYFLELCTGDKIEGNGVSPKPLHYKGSAFHHVIPGFICQGGDIIRGEGNGGDSIYWPWPRFDDHFNVPGILSMPYVRRGTNGSQFFIFTEKTSWMDEKHVVFGQVVEGLNVVRAIEKVGSNSGETSKPVVIADCGRLLPDIAQGSQPPAKRPRNQKNNDIPPAKRPRSQSQKNNDIPPAKRPRSQSQKNNDIPPAKRPRSHKNNDIPPAKRRRNSDIPPAKCRKYSDIPSAKLRKNSDIRPPADHSDIPQPANPSDIPPRADHSDIPPLAKCQSNSDITPAKYVSFDDSCFERRRGIAGRNGVHLCTIAEKLDKCGCYSNLAIHIYNSDNKTNYEIVKFVNANYRAVSGSKYYITFEAKEPSDNKSTTFQAVVYEKIPDRSSRKVQVGIVRIVRKKPPRPDPLSTKKGKGNLIKTPRTKMEYEAYPKHKHQYRLRSTHNSKNFNSTNSTLLL